MSLFLRTLLIAPDLGLDNVRNEIRSISSSLQATVLTDEVTRRDVMDAMSNKSWDIVWVAAHGNSVGIELSDGVLSTSDLTSIVRNTNAKLLVLNTCDGKVTGLELNYELAIDVICVEGDVGDSGAYQFGRLLAQNIASGMEYKHAFDRSKPGQNTKYHYLFGSKDSLGIDVVMPDHRIDDARTIRMMHEVVGEWGKRLDKRIADVESSLRGDIERINNSIESLDSSVQNSVRLPPWHKQVYFFAWFFLFMPFPLLLKEVRDLSSVGWQAALAIGTFSYAASATLWSYMWWGSPSRK